MWRERLLSQLILLSFEQISIAFAQARGEEKIKITLSNVDLIPSSTDKLLLPELAWLVEVLSIKVQAGQSPFTKFIKGLCSKACPIWRKALVPSLAIISATRISSRGLWKKSVSSKAKPLIQNLSFCTKSFDREADSWFTLGVYICGFAPRGKEKWWFFFGCLIPKFF